MSSLDTFHSRVEKEEVLNAGLRPPRQDHSLAVHPLRGTNGRATPNEQDSQEAGARFVSLSVTGNSGPVSDSCLMGLLATGGQTAREMLADIWEEPLALSQWWDIGRTNLGDWLGARKDEMAGGCVQSDPFWENFCQIGKGLWRRVSQDGLNTKASEALHGEVAASQAWEQKPRAGLQKSLKRAYTAPCGLLSPFILSLCSQLWGKLSTLFFPKAGSRSCVWVDT